jgi:hypothetical protein
MKPRPFRRPTPQPTLFDPPPFLPPWETFPLPQRLEALRLLLQLLRGFRPLPPDVPPGREGADE